MRLANECGIMSYGLYISAEGAAAQSRRMQVIANNIANVDTPGFKRQLAVLEARHSEAIEVGDDAAGSASINDISGGVVLRETLDDMSPGTFKHTGVATDMAIDGDGYFQVQRDGQDLLTRAGNFFFGADGVLRTQNGETVLSSEGGPIRITPGIPWRVTEEGAVVQGGDSQFVGLARPQNPGDLSRVGQNSFMPLAETLPVAATERHIRPGYLEQSGVKPTLEMMQMIEASRAFEANVRMIQNHDAMLDSLVNRVLSA